MNFRRGYGVLALSACSAFVCTVLPGQDAADPRRPIPEKAKLAQAVKLIKGIFKDEYAKLPEKSRQLFAETMLRKAKEEKDTTARYALAHEALSFAQKALAGRTILKIIDLLNEYYKLDGDKMKFEVLSSCQKNIQNPSQARGVAEAFLMLSDQEIKKKHYGLAKSAAEKAQKLARRARDIQGYNQAKNRVLESTYFNTAYKVYLAATSVLKKAPGNPKANGEAGKYLCFYSGEWEEGLRMLSKSNDSELRDIAQKDLDTPLKTEEVILIADKWFEYAQKARQHEKKAALQRSLYWYEAIQKPKGLVKLKLERQLKAIHDQLDPMLQGYRLVFDMEFYGQESIRNTMDVPSSWQSTEEALIGARGIYPAALTKNKFPMSDCIVIGRFSKKSPVSGLVAGNIRGGMYIDFRTSGIWIRKDIKGGDNHPAYKAKRYALTNEILGKADTYEVRLWRHDIGRKTYVKLFVNGHLIQDAEFEGAKMTQSPVGIHGSDSPVMAKSLRCFIRR